MMIIDTAFFDRVIKTLETNHNIIRANQDLLKVTEAWLAFGDQTIIQSKEILIDQKDIESRNIIMEEMGDLMSDEFDYDMFDIAMRKTIDSIRNS